VRHVSSFYIDFLRRVRGKVRHLTAANQPIYEKVRANGVPKLKNSIQARRFRSREQKQLGTIGPPQATTQPPR